MFGFSPSFTQFFHVTPPPRTMGARPNVWTNKSNSVTTQDEAEDEVEVCVLYCQKRSTITVCGGCEEHYCAECIDIHTCGTHVVWLVQYKQTLINPILVTSQMENIHCIR